MGCKTPRSHAEDDSNTATRYGFMLAYNQLSGSNTLAASAVGGLGRKGAQRMVILETDGMANVDSTPASGFANNGANDPYYYILPGDSVTPTGFNSNFVLLDRTGDLQ